MANRARRILDITGSIPAGTSKIVRWAMSVDIHIFENDPSNKV